jgi:hypothetical protein
LPLIVHREAVEAYRAGDAVEIDFDSGLLRWERNSSDLNHCLLS